MSSGIKFVHVVTGKIEVIPFKARLAHVKDQSGNDAIRTGSIEKLVSYMNKNGFVRAGKRQQLNAVEKSLIAEAPTLIAELQRRRMAEKAADEEVTSS